MRRETAQNRRPSHSVGGHVRRVAAFLAAGAVGAVVLSGAASALSPSGSADGPGATAPAVPATVLAAQVEAAAAPAAAPAPAAAAHGPVGPGTTSTIELPSGDADGQDRAAWVYRPGVPDSSDLPVVYFLHGYPGTENDLAGAGFPALLDAAFAAGVQPFVVVAPNGQSTIHPDTEWADSTDGKVKLDTFITQTLIHAVEGDHPRDRAHRAIAGHSMGGYGSMNLGLRHPDLYGQIVSVAGYYHIDDPDRMGGGTDAWKAANSPDQHVAAGAGTRILLVADAEEHDKLIMGEALRYLGLATAAGQHPAYVLAPGGHSWSMVAGQVPTIARFLAAGW